MESDKKAERTVVDPFVLLNFSLPDQKSNFKTSEQHIASLENRLAKLKGKDKLPSSKSMIESLAQARESHLGLMIRSDPVDYISSYVPCVEEEDATPTFLDKKLHPERIAVNSDELKVLVENDELSKLHNPENVDTQLLEGDSENSIDTT